MSNSRTVKVLALSLGGTLTQVVGILTGAVLARILTKEDLGTYRQTFLAYSFAAPLLSLSLPSALYYFLPRKVGQARTVLVGNLLLLVGMGMLFTCLLLFGGARLLAVRFHNPALEHTLLLMAPYPLFALPCSALEACLVSCGQIFRLTVFNICSRALLAFAIVGTCFKDSRPDSLILVNVVTMGVVLVPALWLMLRACPGPLCWPDVSLLKDMVKFSIPLGLATILGSLTLQLSNVVVSTLCSAADFAVYSVGAVELPLVGMITGSITTVILADMCRLCHSGDKLGALDLFKTAAVRSATVLFPATIFCLLSADSIICVLYSDKYLASVVPFRLYLLILPIRIVTYGSALMALGLARLVLVRSIFDFGVTALLCIFLVKGLGYIGGVAALLATLYIWTTPYNLLKISKGFGVTVSQLVPIRKLFTVMTIALAGAPPLLLCLSLPLPSQATRLSLAILVYWPLVIYLMGRQDLIPNFRLLIPSLKRITTTNRDVQ